MEVLTSSISRMARTWIILEVPFIGAREIKPWSINVSGSDANLYSLPRKQSRNWSLLCECTCQICAKRSTSKHRSSKAKWKGCRRGGVVVLNQSSYMRPGVAFNSGISCLESYLPGCPDFATPEGRAPHEFPKHSSQAGFEI